MSQVLQLPHPAAPQKHPARLDRSHLRRQLLAQWQGRRSRPAGAATCYHDVLLCCAMLGFICFIVYLFIFRNLSNIHCEGPQTHSCSRWTWKARELERHAQCGRTGFSPRATFTSSTCWKRSCGYIQGPSGSRLWGRRGHLKTRKQQRTDLRSHTEYTSDSAFRTWNIKVIMSMSQ